MVPSTVIRASTRLRVSRISLDWFSAINLAVDVVHTFHHFLRLDARQDDGRNDFDISARPSHLHQAFPHVGDARFYKGARMKLSTGWRANKTRKNRARATRKPKIRWEVLGLPNPLATSLTTSMEDIRRQVSSMASRGFGQGTRSRTAEREAKTKITIHAPDSSSKRRRGATESSQS
jgi:hypothetical protein